MLKPPLHIVLVMIEPPLPFGNAAGRWYHVLLKYLTARGHRVTAFAACSTSEDAARATELFPRPSYDLRCYTFPERTRIRSKLETLRRPFSFAFSGAMRSDLACVLSQDFDVLHLEQLWSGWLGLAHPSRSLVNIHFLLDLDLAQMPAASTVRERALCHLRRRAERRILRSYPHIATLTPELTTEVRRMSPRSTVHTVPMSLDASLYEYRAWSPPSEAPLVSLIGSFTWQPSYSAGIRLLARLWPRIKRQVPNARLQLVGRGADAAFARFAARDISVRSDVPDTIPYFHATDVLLYAPEAGSGTKVKVLEAFALGAPVVTNAHGVEGIRARDGVHVSVGDDDESLIARTVALLRDPAVRERQREAARAFIATELAPPAALDRLEEVYRAVGAREGRHLPVHW